ncbi:MAG: glycosyltransferase family 4 protein [Segetibacter sp.]
MFFCPNGIPLIGDSNTKILSKEKINDNLNFSPCLLFLSNMIIEKGVLVLIEACKILKEKAIKFECHFVGAWTDISEEEFNNKILNNDLTNYIFSHGKKYNNEKLYFYNSADIFVFPTFYHNECFPLVLLEAMQFKLPIVSTNEGGIAEIISDGVTGFIVPKNNASELAKKLELLINKMELRLQMGMAGKDRYENCFTLERFENRLSDILKQAIQS